MWILANNGLLNQMLTGIGLQPVRWLTDPKIALNSVIGVTIWRGLGLNMSIFLAALQDIPHELDIAQVAAVFCKGRAQHQRRGAQDCDAQWLD